MPGNKTFQISPPPTHSVTRSLNLTHVDHSITETSLLALIGALFFTVQQSTFSFSLDAQCHSVKTVALSHYNVINASQGN